MAAPDRDRDQEKVDRLVEGIRAQRRAAVSQAITLVESSRPQHRAQARALLTELAEESGGSDVVRVGISGVPGVGKSTFIEALGTRLVAEGHKVGVLAVDPSSVRTGGSVLGDKTRMGRLSVEPDAFIRPSPSAGTLGGVARATVQAMGVLEAAGYDVILVETVGVGQSEVTVAGMVDTFLFLTLARTGDQLQGIKKGILEIADVIAVNKADGDREQEARAAARDLAGALRLVRGKSEWAPPVVTCSGLHDVDVDDVGRGARGPRTDPRRGARRRAARDGRGRPDPGGVRRGVTRPGDALGVVRAIPGRGGGEQDAVTLYFFTLEASCNVAPAPLCSPWPPVPSPSPAWPPPRREPPPRRSATDSSRR
jgi:LAO/AO transport system kinase